MKSLLLRIIAKIIIFLNIDIISDKISRIKNRFASAIFNCRTDNPGIVYFHLPFRIIGHQYIKVGKNISALTDLRIECIDKYNRDTFHPKLEIGNNVSFNQRCHIGCINRIIIGDNVLIGSNVMIIDHSHGEHNDPDIPPSKRCLFSKGPIVIGNNTWICENVCILPNVTIGKNVIIGAGTVVNKDIPDNCIAVGNPLRIIDKKII